MRFARGDSFKKGQREEREREKKGGLRRCLFFSKRGRRRRRSSGSRSRYQGAALMAALSFCRIIKQTDRKDEEERNNQTCRSIGGARASGVIYVRVKAERPASRIQLATIYFFDGSFLLISLLRRRFKFLFLRIKRMQVIVCLNERASAPP